MSLPISIAELLLAERSSQGGLGDEIDSSELSFLLELSKTASLAVKSPSSDRFRFGKSVNLNAAL